MTLVERIDALAGRVREEFNAVRQALSVRPTLTDADTRYRPAGDVPAEDVTGLLAALSAYDDAEEFRVSQEAAREANEQDRGAAEAVRQAALVDALDAFDVEKDIVIAAAAASGRIYATVADALADVDLVDGSYFALADGGLWLKIDGSTADDTGFAYAGRADITNIEDELDSRVQTSDGGPVLAITDRHGFVHSKISTAGDFDTPSLGVGTELGNYVVVEGRHGFRAYLQLASSAAEGEFSDAFVTRLDAVAVAQSAATMSQPAPAHLQPFEGAKFNHWLEYGQSLSVGVMAHPAKSLTQSYGNLMVGGSVRSSNNSSPSFDPFGSLAFNPLVATVETSSAPTLLDSTAQAALPVADTATGEVPAVGAANSFSYFRNTTLATTDLDHVSVVTATGRGGTSLAELADAGQLWLPRTIDAMAKINSLAAANPAALAVIQIEQGEADYDLATTKEAYKAGWLDLIDTLYEGALSAYGPQKRPLTMFYQTSGIWTEDAADADGVVLKIGMAQHELALENSHIVIYAPCYPVTNKPGGHLDANGSRWLGVQAGKVAHRMLVEGRNWRHMHITQAVKRGREVLVSYHVPVAPIRFGQPYSVWVAEEIASKGYRFTDEDGEVGVSLVEIPEGCGATVRITLGRNPVGELRLWYAARTSQGGMGCIMDSDPTVSPYIYEYAAGSGDDIAANIPDLVGQPYPLNNFAVAQTVIVEDA